MLAASQIPFTNECRSFGLEQYAEKREAPKRIPRPPNAFILYRSDFLKKRTVPPEVEKRQQNLSRIAGQCWNMLPDTEKAVWYSKAAVVRAEHRARYPSHKTGSFHKDTDRLSAKDKRRGSATNSGCSSGPVRRSRPRHTHPYQSPYCEGMFAAIRGLKLSSQASQACLLSPTPALGPPLSTSGSLSPLPLPHLLPPFPSHVHFNWQDSSPVTSENSMTQRNKIGYLLDSSDSETPQWGPTNRSQDLDFTSSEFGSSQEPFPALQRDTFATCVLPHADLEQLPKLRSDLVSQIPLAIPGSNTLSPRYRLANYRSLVNDFGVTVLTDNLAHFNQSLIPLYPLHSDEPNTSRQAGL